ncbi:glutaminyl-peptide cyclotransferase [bacterium]|nr:glutaminyl-peptide cyclotransferase [bacterium]
MLGIKWPALGVVLAACITAPLAAEPASVYVPEVVNSYPHSTTAFTQGLVFWGDRLIESTGGYGQSRLIETERWTGTPIRSYEIGDEYFGEGITVLGDLLYMLTWKRGDVLRFDARFKPLQPLELPGVSWGLTTDGQALIRSDGSNTLTWHAPDDLSVQRRVQVSDDGAAIDKLNELEWVDGLIYANIWHSDRIAAIDPETGRVRHWLDLTGLDRATRRPGNEQVLNGIAWKPGSDLLWVTGKRWGKLYTIRLPERPHP